MVPKVAVIALVGILAVPILLGYALNLDQVTETDYKVSGDPVNVTQLLQTGTDYTYAHADSYQLNTNFKSFGKSVLPLYDISSQKTSYRLQSYFYTNAHPAWIAPLSTWEYRYSFVEYSGTGGYLIGTFKDPDNTTIQTINRLITTYYDKSTMTIEYTYYSSGNNISSGTINVPSTDYVFSFSDSGNFQSNMYIEQYVIAENQNAFADISKGWRLDMAYIGPLYAGETYDNPTISMPDNSRSAIITIDLDSITEDNYGFGFGPNAYLEKTTTSGNVSWQIKQRPRVTGDVIPTTDLYYDPDGSNTYQVKIRVDPNGYLNSWGSTYYNIHYEFRYIGAWPSLIGEANYYQSYEIVDTVVSPNFNGVIVGGFSDHSPRMRVDDAEFRAMEYKIISDKTYDPAAFKANPSTTIDNPTMYGSSITFGGNTYTVNKGNITLGNHDIPVKGLVLSSVPNGSGGYDNKIGETIISTTATPSAITFNGKWSASITTTAQEQYEYTRTEWVAGEFAWDGLDQNFLMVGLLTSLGAFIALGIYARRSKASIWPLLVVCGGAALLFFVML